MIYNMFLQEKHEWWWVYVADRKNHSLITAPVQICGLKEREEVQLKFSAPPKPGLYHYQVSLKSDSYLDFDRVHTVKVRLLIVFVSCCWYIVSSSVKSNKKTARVCFWSENITQVLFLAGKGTRPQVKCLSQAKKSTSDILHSKNT
jgi:hypothetical protein